MATLPQLIEEDIERLDTVLRELLLRSDATTVLIADKGGFLITNQGERNQFDLTTIAALASGAFMANQVIANLVHETSFNSVYQQGEVFNMFVLSVNEQCLLIVIFKTGSSVGSVKYFSSAAGHRIAKQLKTAHERDPGAGLDLSMLNLADASAVFRKKQD